MTKKPRGRPRSYDPEKALGEALETFWTSGFASTSLDDLAAATGMNRPSLYAAFGDKKQLYLKSFEIFAGGLRAALSALAENDAPPRKALERFYADAAEIYLSGPDGPRGCFIICTAPVEATADGDIRKALSAVLTDIDEGLEAFFEKARAKDELAKDADPAARAKLAGAVLHSLAIRARAGETKQEMQALAREAVRLLI